MQWNRTSGINVSSHLRTSLKEDILMNVLGCKTSSWWIMKHKKNKKTQVFLQFLKHDLESFKVGPFKLQIFQSVHVRNLVIRTGGSSLLEDRGCSLSLISKLDFMVFPCLQPDWIWQMIPFFFYIWEMSNGAPRSPW